MYLWVSFLPGFLRSLVIYGPTQSCTLKLLSALDMLQSRSAVFEFLASSDLTFSGSPFPNAKENWFTLPVQWNSWRLMAWPLRRHKETKGIMQLSVAQHFSWNLGDWRVWKKNRHDFSCQCRLPEKWQSIYFAFLSSFEEVYPGNRKTSCLCQRCWSIVYLNMLGR